MGARAEECMRLALASARRGMGRTHPNPSVGAVVFRGARILARGTTQPPGGPHAEVVALRSAERRFGTRALRGASLVVTLEPCCFQGRTGPCTKAIIEAGIRRVYVGCVDPHARVAGRGIRQLRAAGVEVVEGVRREACREHHRGFFAVCECGRPFVTLKLASTLDARIATATGESRWITGPQARTMVHGLRSRVDAIMVGSGTALADDPELSARRGERIIRRPIRVLVDSKLRVPTASRLYQVQTGGETWVLTRARARGRPGVVATGARVFDAPTRDGHLDLAACLQTLAEAGLTTLLVEGGGRLAAALLRAGLIDEIHWLLAPRLIGQEGVPALGPLGLERLEQAVDLKVERVRRLGRDLHIHARLGPAGARRLD